MWLRGRDNHGGIHASGSRLRHDTGLTEARFPPVLKKIGSGNDCVGNVTVM